MKQELRRDEVIKDITTKLDREGKLLIVGEAGTSKSIILMEIMCDYSDMGFEIPYNYGHITDLIKSRSGSKLTYSNMQKEHAKMQ